MPKIASIDTLEESIIAISDIARIVSSQTDDFDD
jgi:hypothetical protein